MINNSKRRISRIASVLAGIYILLDLLMLVVSAFVFGNASITMLAGDVFGLIACLLIIAATFDKRNIKYGFLSFVPLVLGIGKIVSILPAVFGIGLGASDSGYLSYWSAALFGGILYIIISAMYYVKSLSPRIVAALYAVPVVYSLVFGDATQPHASPINSAAPPSVNLLMILSRLGAGKGILIIAAIIMLTLCFNTDAKGHAECLTVRRKGLYIESKALTAVFGSVTVITAFALVILTFRYYTGYTELFWYESTYKWIAKIFSYIRVVAQCGVGAIGLYTAVRAKKNTDRISDKATLLSVILIAAAEACFVAMTTFTMAESDGEGFGDLLLVIWLPVAIIFTATVFTVAIIFSFRRPSVSILIIAAYFLIQLSAGRSNYFGVYPSKMIGAEMVCIISVLLTLYFTAGLLKTPKTKPSKDIYGIYYYPNNHNDLK